MADGFLYFLACPVRGGPRRPKAAEAPAAFKRQGVSKAGLTSLPHELKLECRKTPMSYEVAHAPPLERENMKYSSVTFVILGIWTACAIVVIGRENTSPEQVFLFSTAATAVISFMGLRS